MLVLFLLSFSLHAFADVFVCKDDKGKTIYQDKPCLNASSRKLEILPAPSIEEQNLAQERIKKITEESQQRAAAAELERQQQEKKDAELEKIALEQRILELLEKQAAAEQNVTRWNWVSPWNRWFRKPHHRDDDHHSNHPRSDDKERPLNKTKPE